MTSTRHPNIGRFSMVPLWLLKHPAVVVNPHAVHVYAWLDARYADEHGRAWPRQDRLATDLGLSRATLQRAITALRQAGGLQTAVRRHARRGGISQLEYRVVHDRPPADATRRPAWIARKTRRDIQLSVADLSVTGEAQVDLSVTGEAQVDLSVTGEAQVADLSVTSEAQVADLSVTSEAQVGRDQLLNQSTYREPDPILRESVCTPEDHGSDGRSDTHTPAVQRQPPEQGEQPLRADLQLTHSPAWKPLWPPKFLQEEFRARCGSAPIDLEGWYRSRLAALSGRPLKQPILEFWRAAFEHDVASQFSDGVRVERSPDAALTRTELAEAALVRDRAWGSCRHQPPCPDRDTCIAEIAWARREKVGGVRGRA